MNKKNILIIIFISILSKIIEAQEKPSQGLSYAAIVALYDQAHDRFLHNLPHAKEDLDSAIKMKWEFMKKHANDEFSNLKTESNSNDSE